ncbi:MAG: PAS domain S-box protein [Dehalococcoidia bacterium]|nr:PAS domain S-box protein [Dehalococcoidia bacterium]
MLALIVYDYNSDYRQLSDMVLADQLHTGQAVAALLEVSIDDALSVAWSLSGDPILQSLDTRRADPYLARLKPFLPQFDNLAVLDLEGNAVGLMSGAPPSGAPRPNGADRPYFQSVTATRQPAVSNILISRATGNPTIVAAVPMFDDSGILNGVLIATLDLEHLAQHLQTVRLDRSQAIFLTDPEGTVALHTSLPHDQWGRISLSDYGPVQSALIGMPALEPSMMSLLGDVRMVSTTRTPIYGWVVGVSIPTSVALQPVQDDLVQRLLLYAVAVGFAGLVAIFLAHYMLFRPLKMLRDTLTIFGSGSLGARARLRTGDELEQLGSGFNRMAEDISARERQRDSYITELKKAQERLQRLASIVEFSNDAVIGETLEGAITSWNPAAGLICGYTAEEVIGKSISCLVPPDHPGEFLEILEKVKRGEPVQHYETVWLRADGSAIDVSLTASPIRDPAGEIVGVSTIARDVTERRQMEESFRKLAESSPIGMFIVQQGLFRFVNAKFQEYTGYTEKELLGTDALGLVFPEDRDMVRNNAVRTLKGERDTAYEYRVADKGGEVKWILETVSSIRYEGGRAVVGNFMIITERREMELQLAHLATHDPLTGLPNRRSLEDALNRAVAHARRGVTSALLFLDLDNFKEVNDTLGHAAGDRALVAVAQLLQAQRRAIDLLVRLGGDEFAILLEGTARDDVGLVAERFSLAVQDFPVILDGQTFNLSLSIGASLIDGRLPPAVVLAQADAAMYKAKEQGGNRTVLFESEGDPQPTG